MYPFLGRLYLQNRRITINKQQIPDTIMSLLRADLWFYEERGFSINDIRNDLDADGSNTLLLEKKLLEFLLKI